MALHPGAVSIYETLVSMARRLEAAGPPAVQMNVSHAVYQRLRHGDVPDEVKPHLPRPPLPAIPVVVENSYRPDQWRLLDPHGQAICESHPPELSELRR
jgi:hypothetical protein